MTSLGFDNYAEACKVYLAKYRSRQLNQEPSTLSHRTSLALTSHHASPALASGQRRPSTTHTQTGGSSPDFDSDDPDTNSVSQGNNNRGKGKKRAAPITALHSLPAASATNSASVAREQEQDDHSEHEE
ncbi:hypothetical protein QFC22_006487 [Naganishia vaughanmartiniae]|uniref:Uncharacterized protein n=1 Tax=Naganishia vaughanmartiniae TaxID=1424756 RepID=A0ACC2WKB8_9TREE|nr:hypothetical protein QFC22_006487 [Naganishia vaughanmartiniae]